MKIAFDDDEVRKLVDVSYSVHTEYIFKDGLSDVAYNQYKRKNMMFELDDFNSESMLKSTLVFEHNGRTIKFKCVYDSDPTE